MMVVKEQPAVTADLLAFTPPFPLFDTVARLSRANRTIADTIV